MFSGCDNGDYSSDFTDDNGDDYGDGYKEPIDLGIFTAANKIIPSFQETRTITENWDSKSPTKMLFNILQKFDPENNSNDLDGSNLFAAIHGANETVGTALAQSKAIESQILQEPFEFGNEFTYDHAINDEYESDGNQYKASYAYRMEGSKVHVLATSGVIGSESTSMGQIQGYYYPSTGELYFDTIYLVDYGNSGYSVRSSIQGNENDHTFDMKIATSDGLGEMGTSIAGKGISEGTDAYFLIKMNDGINMGQNGERYYIFGSDSNEETLKNMNVYGYKTDEVHAELTEIEQTEFGKLSEATDYDSISSYLATVDTNKLFTIEDMPTSLGDFNNSNIDLTFVTLPETEVDETAYVPE